MNKKRSGKDSRCPNCRINYSLCFCNELTVLKLNTTVSFFVHIRERILTSNTAHIAAKSLEHATLHYRGEWNAPSNFEILADHTPLYLFPDDEAVTLTPSFLQTINKPIQLIIPDGSWSITRKMKRRENLMHVQSVTLPKGRTSEYLLRTSTTPEGLCTIEAAAYALGIIEPESHAEEHLLRIFKILNARHIQARNQLSINAHERAKNKILL